MFNFRDPTTKSDFGTCSADKVFHFLKKTVCNQYPGVLRILVPSEIWVPLELYAQFESHYLCSTEYFARSHA